MAAIDLGHVKTRFDSDYEASIQIIAGLADLRGPVSSDGTVTITAVGSFARAAQLHNEVRPRAVLRCLQTVCILWISPATPNKLMARFKL